MYNMNTRKLSCIVDNTNSDPLNFWEVLSLVRLHQFENANLVGFSASHTMPFEDNKHKIFLP